ncbi:uncharacterized protein LOC135238497 isoform X1 [Anguilla rostrata]|uniref:uncharacterized protein LOC135238497 isoform X1 n=1 Tax=Anguilla rostrata TaxID=7938 RepID=UPI0030CDE766
MKEGLLNHVVLDRGAGQEDVAGDTAAQPNQMARGLALMREPTEEPMGERTEVLTREPKVALSREPSESLTKEPSESLTKEWTEELMGERTEALMGERTEELMGERTEELMGERTEALTKKRTESLRSEDTNDSLDNGLEGTSEGSVLLESKAPSITTDSEELHPAAPNCTVEPPKGADADGAQEPPVDWLEPLEEDDDDDEEEDDRHSWELDLLSGERRVNGKGEAEEESLAGESEMSGSVAGSERNSATKGSKSGLVVRRRRRRRQSIVDEEWEDWPVLGEGWKRKEVFRRSGFTVGKTDTYYMSPLGDRFRSKIELAKHLAGTIDISTFDFKSGMFLDLGTLRKMRKLKKFRRMSRSARKGPSSPDFTSTPYRPQNAQHRRTPPPQPLTGRPGSITTPPRPAPPNLTTPPRPVTTPPRPAPPHLGTPPRPAPLHLSTLPGPTPPFAPSGLSSTPHSPLHHSQRLRPILKQEAGPPDCTQPELPAPGCSSCGGPVASRELWRKRPSSLCLKCKAEKRKDDSPNIVFRKWLPCGQCRACLVTKDCGMCASCRNGQLKRDSYKPVRCRKRKCLCPIRKKTAKERLAEKEREKPVKLEEPYVAPEVSKVKPCSVNKESDSEFIVCIDGEDEDAHEEEDEDEPVLLSRLGRACGGCAGCLRSADCGYCDRCGARPGPTTRRRARPPCRLRRCQRPARLVQRVAHEGWMGLGRPRPHYSSSHWGNQHKRKAFWEALEFSEEEDDDEDVAGAGRPGDYKLQQDVDRDASVWTSQNCFKADSRRVDIENANRSSGGVPDTGHSTSSVCTLAEGAEADGEALVDEGAGVPWEPELQGLLDALRKMALPPHWVGLLGEGPSLQVLQCSRRSTMADTSLLIDSGFFYQISVQGQPLLLTHPLYREHPRRLPTVAHVVALLLDLERYAVCQGYPAPGPGPSPSPGPAPAPAPSPSQQPFVPVRAAVCAFLVLKTEERCEHCRDGARGP